MKNVVLLIVGFNFLLFAMICPFPPILAVPGIAWRIIIGLLGCFLFIPGIYKMVCKNNF